ncbi:MAG: acyl-CoA dehydrogenase family protein [Dehalococcoidia bacterium]
MAKVLTHDEAVEAATRLGEVFARRAAEHDADSSFPFENFEMLHEAGILAMTVPVERGGSGLGIETLCRVTQAISTGEPSTALVMQQHLLQQAGLARLGRWPAEVYDEVVRATVEEGAVINAARVEPELGTPARGGLPATTARKTANGWSISGRKTYTTGAPILRYAIVWAKTDENPVRLGNFLVPLKAEGVSIDRTWNHLGMRATGSDDLVMDNVEIPEKYGVDVRSQEEWRAGDNISGPQGSISMAALYNGVAVAARNWLVRYLNDRVPTNLGASLATLPRFQAAVGEIESLLYTNNRLIFTLAHDFATNARTVPTSEAGMVKMIVTDNVIKATQLALELTGNPGLSRENELERHYRDALCGRVHTPQTDMVTGAAGRSALGV